MTDLDRVRAVFDGAQGLSGDALESYLADACAGDAELEGLVRRMLDRGAASTDDGAGVTSPTSDGASGSRGAEGTPATVGPYTIVRTLGEGGFGRVYLAEQTSPVRRRVALKLLASGAASAGVLARFEAERQSLAMMEHPGIAKIFDAGETEDGRPYVAMEYVSGGPITEYCESRRLGLAERLELFRRVCMAVQHAHTKGIVHRDLKPGNILVEDLPEGPVPKVIDFGIAKALDRPLIERPEVTAIGQMVGTPLYMSPEQAAGDVSRVDTRSDVYALGVVLYELLTGELPFDVARFKGAAMQEWVRIVRDETPAKPSSRLHHTRRSGTRSGPVNFTPRDERSVRVDLDWVVMRCLEKPRERRYQSPSELSEDIARYMRGDPVDAGPPSARYRLAKLAVRYRGVTVGAALIAAVLVGATAVSARFAISEANQRRLAEDAQRRASAEAAAANAVADFLNDDLLLAASPGGDGPDLRVVTVIERAIGVLGDRFEDDPALRRRMQRTLGAALLRLGEIDRAREQLTLGLQIRDDSELAPDARVRRTLTLAEAMWRGGDTDESLSLLDRAAAMAQSPSIEPEEARRELLLSVENGRGNALKYAGRIEEAAAVYERVIAGRTALLGESDARTIQVRYNRALLHLQQARALRGPENAAAADEFNRRGLREMTAIAADARDALGAEHPETLAAESERLLMVRVSGRPEASLDGYAELMPRMRAVLTDRHWRYLDTAANYGKACELVAEASADAGTRRRLSERAAELYIEAIAGYEVVRGPAHGYTVAVTGWLADLYAELGRTDDALRTRTDLYYNVEGASGSPASLRRIAASLATQYDALGDERSADLWRQRAGDPAAPGG